MRNKLFRFSVIVFSMMMLLFLNGCENPKTEQKQKIDIVKTFIVEEYGEIPTMTFPGKVRAADDANISFRIAGPIKKISVKEGSFVKKGTVVAQMDDRDYQIQFSATEAKYNQVKAEADRVINLYNQNCVSKNDYDKAVYGLEQITALYNSHKNALEDTKLIAPFDGYVKKILFHEGETVGAGMPIISMVSNQTLEVEINIPAMEYIRRDRFKSFIATLDVYPGREFELELISINPSANVNQLYNTRLGFKNTDDNFTPTVGMTAIVTINYTAKRTSEVSIPVEALASENGESFVWIVEDNHIKKAFVNVERLTADGKAVITNGLEKGEEVVAAGVMSLKEGQEVKVMEKKSETNKGGLL